MKIWHVGTHGACPICHQGTTNLKHLLFQCNLAEELWNRLGMMEIIDDVVMIDQSGFVILEHLLLLLLSLLLIIRKIWKWNKPFLFYRYTCGGSSDKLHTMSHTLLFGGLWRYWYSSKFSKFLLRNNMAEVQRWTKPDLKFMKLNVDAIVLLRMVQEPWQPCWEIVEVHS